jgi:hypothetical protein
MRYFVIHAMALSSSAFAECMWSERKVANKNAPSITWSHCSESKVVQKIEVSGITLTPTAKFIFEDPECPECREFYSTPSMGKSLTVISARNSDYDSNVWVLDVKNKKILYFSEEVHGKHILFKWIDDSELKITHAGMGYGTEYYIKPVEGVWSVYKTIELDGLL